MEILLGLVFLIVGIIVVILSVRQRKVCTGVTMATVVDVSGERNYHTNNDYNHNGFSFGTSGEVSLYPVYEYYVGENKYVRKSNSNKRAVFVGQTVQIHYNPNNPTEIYEGKNIMPIIPNITII